MLASLLLVAVGAVVPALSRTYIDMFLIGGQTSLLGVLFTSMAACVLLTLVLTWLQQANLLHGRIISSTLTSARFLRHLLRLPVTFFAQRSPPTWCSACSPTTRWRRRWPAISRR